MWIRDVFSIYLGLILLIPEARGEDSPAEKKPFPELRASGGLQRHEVAAVLLERRRSFSSCHESLKSRKAVVAPINSFEEARKKDSGEYSAAYGIKPDGVKYSTSYVQEKPASVMSLGGGVSFHFTINPDGSVTALRTSRSDVGDPQFISCLEKSIADISFSPNQNPTDISFLVLNFSLEGFQSNP